MTSGVKQALPQVLLVKPNVDRPGFRPRASDRDFVEALGVARTGKHNVPGKQPADPDTRWPRFGTKLDAAIDRTSGLGSKLALKIAEQDSPDQLEAAGEVGVRQEDVQEPAAEDPENVEAAASPALPAIPAAPAQAGRMSGEDQEPLEPQDAPAQADDRKGEVVAMSVDDGKGERGDGPVADGAKAPDGGGSTNRSAPAEPAAKVEARPVSATPEQTPEPQFAGDAGEPTSGDARDKAVDRPDRGPADAAKVAVRAAIVLEQNFPAPMPSTALVLAESIASSGALIPVAERPAVDAIQASVAATSAQSLKIQLHPAELGMVTATLKIAGEQLSIELKVENNEAYQRLSTDSETIVKTLRGLGYDIDRVTIVQPSIVPNATGRSDTGAAIPAQSGRGGEQPGSGAAGGGSAGTGGQQPGGDGANARNGGQKNPAGGMDRSGGGIYI